METFLKIESIMFYVSDLEKSAKFYESILGLKIGWTDEEERINRFPFTRK